MGLISNSDKLAYRKEVKQLVNRCKGNNLLLNMEKMKERVADFRKAHAVHFPLHNEDSAGEIIRGARFLGVHLRDDLRWTLNTTSLIKMVQQYLYFLKWLERASLPSLIVSTFYRGNIGSVMTSCVITCSMY